MFNKYNFDCKKIHTYFEMASAEQMQQMLDLLQQQMKTVTDLQSENARLRDASSNTNDVQDDAGAGDGNMGASGGSVSVVRGYKSKKPDRPMVNANIDDREWALFMDRWGRYKDMCYLNGTDIDTKRHIRLELRECCSSDVNKCLFEYVGPAKLDDPGLDETRLLSYIKSVAVKVVHKEVHRMTFHSLTQDQGEPITQWVARIKAQAFLCDFEIPCTCCTPPEKISYAEEEVAQRLVAGLCNREHKRRILSEAASLTTLAGKIDRLQMLESTEQSAQSLHIPQLQTPSEAAAANKSQYRSNKAAANVPLVTGEPKQKCRWCGLESHPGGKPLEKKSCPAQKRKCFKCSKMGHFSRTCENAEAATADAERLDEDQPLVPTDASMSFSFGTEVRDETQDFRIARNRNGKP